MSDDNTHGGSEPSPASAGSRGVAAAWAAFADDTGDTGVTSLNRASVEEVANRMGWSVVPLYRHPALTDEERGAVDRVRIAFRDMDHNDMTMQQIEDYEAICDLLERTK